MRRALRILTVLTAVVTVVVTLFPSQPASGDDRDLLRTTEAVPYVFFMLDTSASMNASVGGAPVPANGDDPTSKIFIAKRALYNVFLDATEFHYGFASYNQDTVQVNAKHWLYRATLPPSWSATVDYPSLDDLWVLGPLFTDPGNSNVEIDEAGSCAAPLDLGVPAEREVLNRLARLGADGTETVTLWFTDGSTTYRMTVDLTALSSYGDPLVPLTSLDLDLDRVTGGCSSPSFVDVGDEAVVFRQVTDFLHMEAEAPSGSSSGGLSNVERYVGYWPYEDALASFDCGSSSPFSGKGWEGNYDVQEFIDSEDGTVVATNSTQLTGVTSSDVDPYCENPSRCYNVLEHPTFVRDEGRNVDSGDMVPFDWNSNQHDEMLSRLNPNHNTALAADFGIASYFTDQPGTNPDVLRLKNEARRPLIAAGGSPFAKAINDFRCWYAEKRGGQCRNARYPESWEEVARRSIGNEAGCVQPYQILITDGENICGGESPAADTAGLRSQANVRTWVIALAPDGSLDSGLVNAIVNNGKGELVYAENEQDLRDELQKIRSVIEEEARTFASAAVPTVQATVDDKIYVSNFTPVNDESTWPGTVLSFLKPLPLDDQSRPDVTDMTKFLWSAGAELLNQRSGLGPNTNQRRVYYAQSRVLDSGDVVAVEGGEWAGQRTLLDETTKVGMAATLQEKDLWLGLGVPFVDGDEASEDAARDAANTLIDSTYAVKTTVIDGVGPEEYLLGDVFHSDPVIIGSPSNIRYFASDLNGYRDFASRHENRRKVLMVGTNEGMLHAFDAGVADLETVTTSTNVSFNQVKFTNGTGREIFAYVPRPMLGELRQRATTMAHDWGVDGSVRAADMFIDPVYTTAPDENDREWRTVVVGGYRRGATGYYALDITHPDALQTRAVGLPSRDVLIPVNTNAVPGCHNATGDGDLGCDDELRYPAPLWEFQDQIWYEPLIGPARLVSLDEDGTGGADLSNSWSVPNLGRIRICTGTDCLPSNDPLNPDDLEDRYVAVFGGGLPGADPATWGTTGNYIYIVDVETGKAIYKRRVDGSVASEPAAVDTDNDGYLDRVYFGTTAGYMYRVDLVEFKPDGSGGLVQRPFPTLEDFDVRDVDGTMHFDAVQRVPLTDSDGPIWMPVKIFDTQAARSSSDSTLVRRPIFLRPSVLFVAELGKYALSFGTGDREDLWRPGNLAEGRFYTFVDDSDVASVTLPIDESNLRRVALADANIDLSDPNVTEKNFLVDRTTFGERGWVMVLDARERLINDPFNLSGVSFFVTFSPRSFSDAGECSREGDSRIFAVNTANANGLLRDVDKNRVRFIERKAFATAPFTEQAQTKNPDVDTEGTADDTSLGQHLEEVMEELKTLFPDNCKFGNYRIDVKTVMSDTGVVFVAPIPVCIIEKNWKEFDY